MSNFLKCCLVCMLMPLWANSQQDTVFHQDSINYHPLDDVIVIGQQYPANKKNKILSSLDGYLETTPSIKMIKRGAYAWEPLLNGMASERSVVTIDGMRIYGACTDKMDPVTSYVEISNLSKANIHNGQSGAANGATIAGSLDLVRRKSGFINTGINGSIFTGLETSNMQKVAGTTMQYASDHFFTNIDFTYRHAGNYKAGGNKEILYSQFTKYNLSGTAGWKLNEHQQVVASLIYDRATDVGYPALPMDVSLAKAFIGSVQYEMHKSSSIIRHWETKLYYNQVTHIMDDTKRPVVPIRMDMPGWTKTAGFYSRLYGEHGKHRWTVNLSGHYNTSLAEMTMFANHANEKDMFMLTWPGVHTFYTGIFIEDNLLLSSHWNLLTTLGTGMNNNNVKDNFGFESLRIFYPAMQQAHSRWLMNASAKLLYQSSKWQHNWGLGYGERAPSISEGYGFYLFNSFDRFDYIGNPYLANERSFETSAATAYTSAKIKLKAEASYFRIFDYIIGKPNPGFSPMTIGANGIKVYEQLPQASIFNANLSGTYQVMQQLQLSGKAVYRRGKSKHLNLPMMQPFSYGTTLQYQHQQLIVEGSMEGALEQTQYGPDFGETSAKAYTIFNLSVSRQLSLHSQKLAVKAGVENLLDRYYSTFADWNRIPRMGRNVFANLIYSF